ncbi:hypothetical protein Tco_0594116 [Tanacetum coccineum]
METTLKKKGVFAKKLALEEKGVSAEKVTFEEMWISAKKVGGSLAVFQVLSRCRSQVSSKVFVRIKRLLKDTADKITTAEVKITTAKEIKTCKEIFIEDIQRDDIINIVSLRKHSSLDSIQLKVPTLSLFTKSKLVATVRGPKSQVRTPGNALVSPPSRGLVREVRKRRRLDGVGL